MNMLRSAAPAPSAPPARHHRQHDSTARQLACERLFIDVGANAGDSLGKFYTEPSCYEHCNERRTYPNGVSCKPAAETCGLQNGQWLGECSTANETCFCHSQAKANKCGWEWPYWMPLAARRQYCAVAFEPNPSLVGPLQSRANDLVRTGAAPHIRVRGGIAWSTRDGVATFGIDNSTFGSSLVLDKKSMDKLGKVARGAPVGEHPIQVRTLDAVTYLRSLTAPRISVKLDVEGSEFELLRDLLASGALCERVENFWIECTCAYLPPPCPSRLVLTHQRTSDSCLRSYNDSLASAGHGGGRVDWRKLGLPVREGDMQRVYAWMLTTMQGRHITVPSELSPHCRTFLGNWA